MYRQLARKHWVIDLVHVANRLEFERDFSRASTFFHGEAVIMKEHVKGCKHGARLE